MCLKNEQRLFRRVTGADALSQQQYYKEHESWVAEFCFGYWAFLFRSFSCSRCVRTTRRRDRGNNMEQLEPLATGARLGPQATSPSAVSWPAIIAGAFVAAAVSLVLLTLGSGLGFAAISPWPGHGISATTFVVTSAIWLIVTQWISSGFGGYVAGRLRTRWMNTHTHEVFFRDTAHGLITWAVATVLVAAVFASSALSAGGREAAASGASAALQSTVPQPEKRIDEPAADRADADAVRKAASEAAVYTALSMLVGAFIASVSAALGGRLRDEHV
jgi:hypothetical protein